MLVLSRHKGETIIIGNEPDLVRITVVDIKGDRTRIGISAPEKIPVHRQEVYHAIQGRNTKRTMHERKKANRD